MARRKHKKKSVLFWLALFVVIVVTINLGKNWFIKSTIEKSATAALGVPVTIKDFNLSALNGEVTVRGLTIGNPSGFESPELFRLVELESRINLSSIMQPTIIIDYIRINGATVFYEINKNGNNIGGLYQSLVKSEPGTPQANATKPTSSGRQLIIRDLSITNATVEPSITLGGQTLGKRVPLADMHLRDIGREGKTVSLNEATQIVVATIGKNAGQRLPGNIFEQGLGNITKGIKDIGQGILGNIGH